MAEAEKLETSKNRRKALRTTVTKILNKIENLLKNEDVTVEDLEENLEALNNKFKALKATDSELDLLMDPKDMEKEYETSEKYSDNVISWRTQAKKKISELNLKFVNIEKQEHKSAIENNTKSNTISVKLPKLTIPRFEGNVNEWLTFWNTFESSIHNNKCLTNVDKFNYLKAHLFGNALKTIEGFPISDTTYYSAISLLKERYGNDQMLKHAHMSNLLAIKPLRNSADICAFRKFYDNLSTEIRNLEALGTEIESISSVLCTSILKCIPQDILIDLNKSENEKALYDVKYLLEYLSRCLKAREKAILIANSVSEPTVKKYDKITKHPFTNEKKAFTASDLVATSNNEKTIKCVFCGSHSHAGMQCGEALKFSLEERKNILMKKGACFKCLEAKKHISRNCKKNIICKHCSRKHASLLCFKKYKIEEDNAENKKDNDNTETSLLSYQSFPKAVYLQTLIVRIRNQGAEYFVRAILDTASSKSYISKFVARKLHLKSFGKLQVTHGLFGGSETTVSHNRYFINLMGLNENENINIEVMEQEKICSTVPRIRDINCMNELKEKHIFLSDICSKSNNCLYEQDCNEIHVLLGADVVGKLFTGKIENLSCGLVAMQTKLGWTTMGKINDNERDSSLLVLSLYVNDAKITDLWNLDSLGIVDPAEKQSREELQNLVWKHFEKTVTRESDGRYRVSLPWINGRPSIPDNKDLAVKRLKNNVKNLKSYGLLNEYEQVFNEWEEEGIIQKVKCCDDLLQVDHVHYLPHRAVLKPNSTTKIRPVFDGSAHLSGYPSINDCIEKGPNLIELIPSVLNRFRQGKIGVVADIRKAFLQISLDEKDRDYLRFFWWRDGDPENIIIYKHCRVVFGISCSPFLLAATLTHHLEQAPELVRDVAIKLKESLYVDNCVASVESLEELEYFRSETRKLLASAKFDLRGWRHNKCAKFNFDSEKIGDLDCENEKISVLGLLWDLEKDTLSCDFANFKIEDEPVTKRNILALTHRIFDPIGFTCPVTLIPKLLLQKCWKIKSSWDSKLPDEIVKEFQNWRNQVTELENLAVPRRLSYLSLFMGKLSLHIFCDACKTSYATCIFIRNEFPNHVTCQLVQARSRVAPLKEISIPRLELLACCIGARLVDTVSRDLKIENIQKFYWSDSMDALHWIKGEGPWATFVANRVKEINKLSPSDAWNFVPGHMNPADLPSRGCSPKSLCRSEWWLGPAWLLKLEDSWPKCNITPNMDIVNAEKKKTIITAPNLENKEIKFYDRYSSYTKILRITGWILRFCNNSKKVSTRRTSGLLTSEELRRAEIILLKLVQRDSFQDTSENKLKSLQTITDSDGLLRVKTKIFMREDTMNFRLPIVLPSNHNVVQQLIIWKHRQLGHCGVQLLMSVLREDYWVLKCRKTVKRVINKCTVCKKFVSKPPEVPESVLPRDRVRNASVFEIIGLDLAGPLHLKDESKVWILIITCAVYRAVHLELLTSLSTNNFILGLSRFIARRGRPSIIYSDHGTNFVGGQNLLKNIDLEKLKSLNKFSFIEWRFIPPSAPWWGGFWERLVGIMKRILRKVLGKSSLSYEELLTVICECENVINSRPITYVTEDIKDLSPLTPSMFLKEITEIGIPELEFLNEKKINKRYIYRAKLSKDLRERFRSEYLGTLRQPLFTSKKAKALEVGDIVLIWTDHCNRLHWPLGQILELCPSTDGVIRVAKLRTTSGILIRPVKKLCPLELSDKRQLSVSDNNPEHSKILITRRGRVVRPPDRLQMD